MTRRPPRGRTLLAQGCVLALTGLLAASAWTQTIIPPNDPGIVYTEFAESAITATEASFSRTTVASGCCPQSSPGTRASFVTDATQLVIDVDYVVNNPSVPLLYEFGLEIDGVPQPSFGSPLTGPVSFAFSQAMPVAREFTIIWPFGSDVDLKGLQLSGGTPALLGPPTTRPRLRYVAFGDSITHGAVATNITDSYPHLVGDLRGWSVLNMGFSGHKVVASDGTALANVAPDLLTIAIGTNDFGQSTMLGNFVTDYDGWITNFRAIAPQTPVLCITPILRANELVPNLQNLILEDYRVAIRNVIANRSPPDVNLYLLEGLDMLPLDLSFLPDGLHPGDAGFIELATRLSRLNLVRNDGFELGPYVWDDLGGTGFSQAPAPVHAGMFSLRVDPGGRREQVVHGLSDGQCFTLTAFAQVDTAGESGTIDLELLDVAGAVVGTFPISVTATTFTQHSVSGVGSAGAVRARIAAHKTGGTGSLYVDDLELILAEPSTLFLYDGCLGLNPPGSLTHVSGAPVLGDTLVLGVDNPLGTQPVGSLPFLLAGAAPVGPLSCGTSLANAGMAAPGTPGELLIDLGQLFPGAIFGGAPWQGAGMPVPIGVSIPTTCALLGVKIYVQGYLWDVPGAHLGLTGAMEVQIGN